MATKNDEFSFYFFDFDDNIMVLDTKILIMDKGTGKPEPVSTGDFADISPLLGKPGDRENSVMFDKSFRNFRDIPEEDLEPGQKQYFVEDIEKAISSDNHNWQGPSWDIFYYACEKQRPVSIITARGHRPETLKAGVRVLVDKKKIPKEPNYLTIFPVGNDDVRRELLDYLDDRVRCKLSDDRGNDFIPEFKRAAIKKSVNKALEIHGIDQEQSFGMSDDDPQNVSLIIRAMCECKKENLDKRFFVISTYQKELVKLEVFPYDFPVLS